MGHSYSRNPDHIRSRHVPAPTNETMDSHLKEIAVWDFVGHLANPENYPQKLFYLAWFHKLDRKFLVLLELVVQQLEQQSLNHD